RVPNVDLQVEQPAIQSSQHTEREFLTQRGGERCLLLLRLSPEQRPRQHQVKVTQDGSESKMSVKRLPVGCGHPTTVSKPLVRLDLMSWIAAAVAGLKLASQCKPRPGLLANSGVGCDSERDGRIDCQLLGQPDSEHCGEL